MATNRTVTNDTERDTDHDAASGDPARAGRRRDRCATKQALLDAAVEVFADHGFDAATTREVASTAGVNEGLIQRYFGGKTGLLMAVVEGFCGDRQRGGCTLGPCGGDLKSEIAGFLCHELQNMWENRDFMRVLFSRAIVDPELAKAVRRHFETTRVPVLIERLSSLQAAGRIAPDIDIPAVASMLTVMGFGFGFMQQVVFEDDPKRLREVLDRVTDIVADGIAARSAGCPPRS